MTWRCLVHGDYCNPSGTENYQRGITGIFSFRRRWSFGAMLTTDVTSSMWPPCSCWEFWMATTWRALRYSGGWCLPDVQRVSVGRARSGRCTILRNFERLRKTSSFKILVLQQGTPSGRMAMMWGSSVIEMLRPTREQRWSGPSRSCGASKGHVWQCSGDRKRLQRCWWRPWPLAAPSMPTPSQWSKSLGAQQRISSKSFPHTLYIHTT